MTPIHLAASLAALLTASAAGPNLAEPPAITLPSHALPAPPPSLDIPLMLGAWQDADGLLLPPGIGRFETYSDVVTFHADGTWTQVIDKSGGQTRSAGYYTWDGSRLTLDGDGLTGGRRQYEVTRSGDALRLVPVGPARAVAFTIKHSTR